MNDVVKALEPLEDDNAIIVRVLQWVEMRFHPGHGLRGGMAVDHPQRDDRAQDVHLKIMEQQLRRATLENDDFERRITGKAEPAE